LAEAFFAFSIVSSVSRCRGCDAVSMRPASTPFQCASNTGSSACSITYFVTPKKIGFHLFRFVEQNSSDTAIVRRDLLNFRFDVVPSERSSDILRRRPLLCTGSHSADNDSLGAF
jgi:hypothetical protein